MRIIFANISYMRSYIGKTEYDIPVGAGKWVKENKDACEKWNFMNEDGYCYGFVQIRGSEFHIERLEDVSKKDETANDVLVVWCSPKDGKTVIVGWYRDAVVSRYYMNSVVSVGTGIPREFFCWAKAENCYLLPEEERTYVINRASKNAMGSGFGQSNIWYADSEYAKEEIVPKVADYIDNYSGERINRTDEFFKDTCDAKPLTEEELNLYDQLYKEQEWAELLPIGYRKFRADGDADTAAIVGAALCNLLQYKDAIKWLEKAVAIEGPKWDTTGLLACLYQQLDDFDRSTEYAMLLFDFTEMKDDVARADVYSILADNYQIKGDYEEAIKWLEKLLEIPSIDDGLRTFTMEHKKELENLSL